MDEQEPTNVFSLSDQVLSDQLYFIGEIGCGNWGSVWLCRPRADPGRPADDLDKLHDTNFAVKLVHRSETPTDAARVRSLWNEMKIVRTFGNDPHPSIIPFHSFIITPSYALITMAFLPTLMPVEVDESKAMGWFRSLLSGVEFLHKRGVVHNDIKPANILLSHENVPVLVDFGFAERYDLDSHNAFHSNLSYGTPEYLSPERAQGILHDTRKSDVWSLGISFFEILIGRTPFEHSDSEPFTTEEELEMYWLRTLRGKWVGRWRMSKRMEKLIRRMIAPNADLRCTASEAMSDSYWYRQKDPNPIRRKSASVASSLALEDVSKIINMTAPWLSRSTKATENGINSRGQQGLEQTTRPKSQPKILASKKPDRVPFSHHNAKENIPVTTALKAATTRKHIASPEIKSRAGILGHSPPVTSAIKALHDVNAQEKGKHSKKALADVTGLSRNVENYGKEGGPSGKNLVHQRIKEWERERERLREITRVEELAQVPDQSRSKGQEKENLTPQIVQPMLNVPLLDELNNNILPRLSNDRALDGLKHSLKTSMDRTVQLYRTSRPKVNTDTSIDRMDDTKTKRSRRQRQSMGDGGLLCDAKSSLPVRRHEQVAPDNRFDRMTLWIKNVEKVVEDTRQTFAATTITPLPPLPVSPSARNTDNRSTHLPHKVLTANQIFTDRPGSSNQPLLSSVNAVECPGRVTERNLHTPQRTRRATVSTRSPEPVKSETTFSVENSSPSKHKAKSRSHGNIMQPISSISVLELELKKQDMPVPPPRLSTVLDRSLFVTPPPAIYEDDSVTDINPARDNSMEIDELTSSPFVVEPYPPRRTDPKNALPDLSTLRRLEGVYDRILMATSGVKRLGRGYQSDNLGPVGNAPAPNAIRRPMPPPVSSVEKKRIASVDELGVPSYRRARNAKDAGSNTVTLVRRALKAIVAGRPAPPRRPC